MDGLYVGIQGDLYRVTRGAVEEFVQVYNVSNNTASDHYATVIEERIRDGFLMPFQPAPENGPGEMFVTYMTRDNDGNAVNRSTIVQYDLFGRDPGIFAVRLGEETVVGTVMHWPEHGWSACGGCTDPQGDFNHYYPTRLAATEVMLGVYFDPDSKIIGDDDDDEE
jgi:hypothetical protein